jgi:serine/threonine protein kinase
LTLSAQKPEVSVKYPGDEPLPGYRLLVPLGRGGFGEVWKCEAPGGLQKAIKFVTADGERFRQELAAFEQIRAIRHPFLLGLDRVELAAGELVMVMELADCQFLDRYRICLREGLPGIPRDELVLYLEEVAEALDMIGSRYGLQHLDVKPENLFLVAGHAKIGDYGLVRRTEHKAKDDDNRGFTPRYTAPEVLLGRVDTRSDQYSLALVYVQLLTGCFPFSGQTAQQLVMQHISTPPDLSFIPETDRNVIGRALAKEPNERFPSCLAFVRSLSNKPLESRSREMILQGNPFASDTPLPGNSNGLPRLPKSPAADNRQQEVAPEENQAAQGSEDETVPVNRRSNVMPMRLNSQRKSEPPPPVDPFANFLAVMPVDVLINGSSRAVPPTNLSSADYVDALIAAVSSSSSERDTKNAEESPTARFLCTLPPPMVPFKLAVVCEHWGLTLEPADLSRLVLSRESKPLIVRKPGKSELLPLSVRVPDRLEVIVRRAESHSAELAVQGSLSGTWDKEFVQQGREDLPKIIAEIQKQLQTVAERRAYPRHQTEFEVRVYPLYPDGEVGAPFGGRCLNLSVGGVKLLTPTPVRTERIYVEFHQVEAVRGKAIYVRVVRTAQDTGTSSSISGGRFRLRS